MIKQVTLFSVALLWLAVCDASAVATEQKAQPLAIAQGAQHEVVMYKSPTCGCCGGWADHLRQAGFTVTEHKRDDMAAVKTQYGVPDKLASCHTAMIDGYIIEGHVPAADVERLLKERPNIMGLTAPGMPMNSPGMQEENKKPQGYDVLSFTKDGQSKIFTHY